MAQYRCVENGKTLFTDKPCASSEASAPHRGYSPKVIGDSGNSAYSSGYGDWRGQVQYQATFKGQPLGGIEKQIRRGNFSLLGRSNLPRLSDLPAI